MNKNMVQNLIDELSELRGATVSVFGQPTEIEKQVGETTIDTIKVLETLKGDEADLTIFKYIEEGDYYEEEEADSVESFIEYMEEADGLKEICHHNSYNWCAPLSNHIDYIIYQNTCNDKYYVQLMCHKYGDARGNYTDYVLLEYNNELSFLELISESDFSLEDDHYCYDIRITSDTVEVWTLSEGEYVGTTYGDSLEEFRKNLDK